MYRSAVIIGLTVTAMLWPAHVDAQDWRTITSRRQHAGEDRLRVDVEFGAGRLKVEPAAPGALYEAMIRYDASSFTPVTRYSSGRLMIGLEGGEKIRPHVREGGQLNLGLGPGIPLDLDLSFGAAEAEIELGGLRIRKTKVATGASETRLRFSRPNPERMESLALSVGAAAFRAAGLGNANAERLQFEGGVGDVVLDFTGEWQGDMSVDIEMGVGTLTLRVPRGVGVRIGKETFLMAFDSQGLIKRGEMYYSEDWERAAHRLTVEIGGALGSIGVEWLSRDAAVSN